MDGTRQLARADEDTFVLPEAWRRKVHPRRGGSSVPPPAKPADKTGKADLGGPDDPVAATRIAAGTGRAPEVVADAWAVRHGLVFAAEASAEWFGWDLASRPALDRVRALLASADDDVYAAAVEALGARRREGEWRRVGISYLVPTETAWAAECAAEAQDPMWGDGGLRNVLLCALSTPDHFALVRDRGKMPYRSWQLETVATLCDGAGDNWLGIVDDEINGQPWYDAGTFKLFAAGLAQLPTNAAFAMLLEHIEKPYAVPALDTAARNFPRRALRMLGAAALGTGKPAALARTLLRAHAGAHAALAEAELPLLPAGVGALITPVLETVRRGPEASAGALPEALVAPPWTRPGAGKPPFKPLPLTPPDTARFDWLPGEREEWSAARVPYTIAYREPWPDDIAALADYQKYKVFLREPVDHVVGHVAQWRPTERYLRAEMFKPVAARFGEPALPMLLHVVGVSPNRLAPLLMPVVTLDVARRMAGQLTRKSETVRATGRVWLARHASEAARLLIPDALGKPGAAQHAAVAALRQLAAADGPDFVTTAAAEYGPAAVNAVTAVLATDPLLLALPARLPKLPAWADPAALPQIQLRDGAGGVPEEAVRHLLTALAISEPGNPYPTLAEVQAACTPESLAAFAWSLFETWRLCGMPPKESWALTALGFLGDDDVVRRLDPIIRAWPGAGGHKRAVEGLHVLAAIGSDVALVHLNRIAQRVKFAALKARAQELITEVADGLGFSADQLADRLVPDCGLDASGSTVVDYGTRTFTVGFDEQLKPYVLDQDGKRRKDLPAPNAQDDAERAAAERKRYTALKKEVRAVASDTLRRFEAAMVTERAWSAVEFRELLVGHPLVGHLTSRLVWVAETDAGKTAFRVTDSRRLADASGVDVVLSDAATVRIAHPTGFDATELALWSDVFANRVQPFPQLGRPVHRLGDDEAAGLRLTRFEGIPVPTKAVLGLVHRGWRRGPALDNGVERWISRRIADDLFVVATLTEGIPTGFVEEFDTEQTLDGVWAASELTDYPRHPTRPLGDLPVIAASEIVADLTWLIAQAKG